MVNGIYIPTYIVYMEYKVEEMLCYFYHSFIDDVLFDLLSAREKYDFSGYHFFSFLSVALYHKTFGVLL